MDIDLSDVSKIKGYEDNIKDSELEHKNTSLFVIARPLVETPFREDFSTNLRQFIIYNPTTRVIKVGFGNVATGEYIFRVGANTFLISPPINFSTIALIQESFTAASLNPTLWVYNKVVSDAGVFVIP